MVLLTSLLNCLPKERIVVVHCHHGIVDHSNFRDQAVTAVARFCKKMRIIFERYKSESNLCTEAECREFRLSCFQSQCRKYHSSIVALAHHRDDWKIRIVTPDVSKIYSFIE